MAWIYLLVAGAGEIIGVAGFERLTRRRDASGLLITLAGFGVGLAALHLAMATLPMTVAYAIFTGIGTLGSTVLGILFWNDSARPARLACIGLIVVSVIGLRATL